MIGIFMYLEEPPIVHYLMIFTGWLFTNNFPQWHLIEFLVYSFDLCTQTWSVITPSSDSQIPSGRLFHAATVVGDGM